MTHGGPNVEYASRTIPQFFIGRESPKDGWITNPDKRKKKILTSQKGEPNNIEPLTIKGQTPQNRAGYPKVKKNFGLGEDFLLTFGFKDGFRGAKDAFHRACFSVPLAVC